MKYAISGKIKKEFLNLVDDNDFNKLLYLIEKIATDRPKTYRNKEFTFICDKSQIETIAKIFAYVDFDLLIEPEYNIDAIKESIIEN